MTNMQIQFIKYASKVSENASKSFKNASEQAKSASNKISSENKINRKTYNTLNCPRQKI